MHDGTRVIMTAVRIRSRRGLWQGEHVVKHRRVSCQQASVDSELDIRGHQDNSAVFEPELLVLLASLSSRRLTSAFI